MLSVIVRHGISFLIVFASLLVEPSAEASFPKDNVLPDFIHTSYSLQELSLLRTDPNGP